MAMKIEVSFWGVTRRLAGVDTLSLELPQAATVEALAQRLSQRGDLAAEMERCAFAIGDIMVSRTQVLQDGDQVAVLPPVSGG